MYRAFAPFLEGDKGDWRVTGIQASFPLRSDGKLKGSLMEQMSEDKLGD